jgi:hypothetical protein
LSFLKRREEDSNRKQLQRRKGGERGEADREEELVCCLSQRTKKKKNVRRGTNGERAGKEDKCEGKGFPSTECAVVRCTKGLLDKWKRDKE